MDDQRTTLPHTLSISSKATEASPSSEEDDFVDILCRTQSARIEDQRCAFTPHLVPADQEEDEEEGEEEDEHVDPEELFDLIFHCQVRERERERERERAAVMTAYTQESHTSDKHQYKHCLFEKSSYGIHTLHCTGGHSGSCHIPGPALSTQ